MFCLYLDGRANEPVPLADCAKRAINCMASTLQSSLMPPWRCPVHRTALVETDSRLTCPQAHDFPVIRGIPRFVPSGERMESFGVQWQRYPRTQLDSYTGLSFSRDRLKRCLGDDLWRSLPGKSVLEAGCGAGRFTEVLLAQQAVVTSVDLSSAVEANADLFPIDERHRVAQADVTQLPFEGAGFDLVVCLGVLQHTLSPERTIVSLYSHVKPGGWLVVDCYTLRRRWSNLKFLYRAVIKRLPAKAGLRWTDRLVDTFLPMHRRTKNAGLAGFLLTRVSPLTTYYRSIPSLPETLQSEWAHLDTHNNLTNWNENLRTVPQVQNVLRDLSAEQIECQYAGNGVEARCRRPEGS